MVNIVQNMEIFNHFEKNTCPVHVLQPYLWEVWCNFGADVGISNIHNKTVIKICLHKYQQQFLQRQRASL